MSGTRVWTQSRTPLLVLALAFAATIFFAVPRSPEAAAQENPAAALYLTHCGGCHQPSGLGVEGTFPPLAGNESATDADYVLSTIVDGLSGELVVDGVTYNSAMPPVAALSGSEAAIVAQYVASLASGDITADDAPAPVDVGSGDADIGHGLFRGSVGFAAGGSACASCHSAGDIGSLGGPSLGPNLTDVHSRFGGDAGTAAWLANPSSETMRPVFDDHPLENGEIAHLVAFLADAPNRNEPLGGIDWLSVIGGVGALVLLGGMAIAWRGMRQTYVSTLTRRSSQ